jgi:starch-binding outer membrane protein, SusD/RagB family
MSNKNFMITKKMIMVFTILALIVAGVGISSCTNLDAKVYSVVPNSEFWQTPAEIAAGVAPAYAALQNIPEGDLELVAASSDEMVIPIRGADWLDGNQHTQEWLHTWTPDNPSMNGMWNDVFGGIGKANFTLNVVNSLATPPPNLAAINAEVKSLRDYFYFLAMDRFGNVPYVTSFNVDPSTLKQSASPAIYDSIVADLTANIALLPGNVDATTYGRFTKWSAFALLAKLYLNKDVYTATTTGQSPNLPAWQKCMDMCDSIIGSGLYSLESNYFDNFSPNNSSILSGGENIFVVPFDKANIGGNNWEMATLHYQNNLNLPLSGSPWNGFCSTADYYSNFDTSSVYTVKGSTTFRTFLDQRAGQYLIGQQYAIQFTYPPSTNVVYAADASLKINDLQFSIPLVFNPIVSSLSDPSGSFRAAGLRNIKYYPDAGTAGGQSNDMVLFRLADIYLMRAEADLRLNGTVSGTSLGYVNAVRQRAYSGDASHNWTAGQVTLASLLAERARELSWEGWRRNDLIRYDVENGTHDQYFGAARNPSKTADPDAHLQLFPIPSQQITANANLHQNPGY